MSLKISLLAVAVLSIGQVGQFAWADEAAKADPQSFSAIAGNRDAAAAFAAMKKGHRLPDWVARGGTESPANTVSFGGHDVYVMSACKPHDCGAQRIAVMYDPQAKRMVGVLSIVDPKRDVERLTWLNIGGDNESIDGRTILYAALTGSLENHPGAFSYK